MPGKSDYKIYKTIGPTVIKNLNYLDRAKSGLSLDVTPVPDLTYQINPDGTSSTFMEVTTVVPEVPAVSASIQINDGPNEPGTGNSQQDGSGDANPGIQNFITSNDVYRLLFRGTNNSIVYRVQTNTSLPITGGANTLLGMNTPGAIVWLGNNPTGSTIADLVLRAINGVTNSQIDFTDAGVGGISSVTRTESSNVNGATNDLRVSFNVNQNDNRAIITLDIEEVSGLGLVDPDEFQATIGSQYNVLYDYASGGLPDTAYFFQGGVNFEPESTTTTTTGVPGTPASPEEPEFVGIGNICTIRVIPETGYTAASSSNLFVRFIDPEDVAEDGTTTLEATETSPNTVMLERPTDENSPISHVITANKDYLIFNDILDIEYRVEVANDD